MQLVSLTAHRRQPSPQPASSQNTLLSTYPEETRMETFYEVMRRQGISRRSFLKYCSLTATSLGLGPAFVPQIAHAMETKPRTPVLWLHALECTCCSESFIRSAHPLASPSSRCPAARRSPR